MSASSFLESNGLMVRTPARIRKMIPEEFLSIQPRVFKMMAAKSEIADAQYLAAAVTFTLPMPIHASPIVNALTTELDKLEWKPKYVPMLMTYAQLGFIRVAINSGLFAPLTTPELVKSAEEQCQKEGLEQSDQLYNDIDSIIMNQHLSEQQKIDNFLGRLEIFTVQTINRIEKMVHTCVIGEKNVPLQMCLTPMDFPTIDQLHPSLHRKFWDLFVKYWQAKVDITNIELKRDADIDPTQWITIEGLADTPKTVPKEQMWKGYLTVKTAQEYFNFFKE